MKQLITILVAATAFLGVSCIENDIPYPLVEINIESVGGEGFSVKEIDASKRTVTLMLDEGTDIRNVRIDKVQFGVVPHNSKVETQELIGQIRASRELTGTFDLRTPLYATLSLYQDYDWAISAEQQIERYFSVGKQVGATVIDAGTRTVKASVAKGTDLTRIEVTALKLEAEGAAYSPTMEELSGTSFESVRFVDVSCHGRTERWLLYVEQTDITVELTGAYAWSKVIWLYGSGIDGVTAGFRYRKKGETTWQEVPGVTSEGGTFTAHLAAEPETTYEVLAYSGADQTDPVEVKTDPVATLVNGSFEEWCTVDEVVYPYAPGGEPYWSTGNKGSKIASTTLTDKCDPRPGSSGRYGADLRSQFANIAGLGKFAAGNLFLGEYIRNAGTDGILTFGRPFKLRPTKLRLWVKYAQGTIDKVKKVPVGSNIKEGDPDNGHIYIALGTWTAAEYGKNKQGELIGTAESPICVDTRDVSTFFKPNGKDVIAYGEEIFTKSTDGWKELTIDLVYNAKDIVPTHLMIVCSASRWGDYFTGSTKSEMWLDDFELIYDY